MKTLSACALSTVVLVLTTNAIASEFAGEDLSGTLCSVINTPSSGGARWSINLHNLETNTNEVVFGVTKNRKIQSVACSGVTEPVLFSMRETQTGDYEIYSYDPAADEPLTQLTDNETDDFDVTKSSDGQVFAYQYRLNDDRQAIKLLQKNDDGEFIESTLASASPFVQPALSSNGMWMVFVQLRPSFFAVMRYNVTLGTYSEIRKVPRRKKLYHPSVSNDGNIVGWTENKIQNRYLVKNIEEDTVTEVLNDVDGIEHGTLSSDGKMIAYSINAEASRKTFITNLDTLEVSEVSEILSSPDRYLGVALQGKVSLDIVETDANTSGVECDYSYSALNESTSVNTTSTSSWTCSEATRDLAANGIPDHAVGEFPNSANPNTISEQTVSASITLTPNKTEVATTLGGPLGPQGYVLNGVKIDAGTGGSCTDYGDSCSGGDNSGAWSLEALGYSSFDFFGADENNAHVQPDGTYHYHGMPEGFVASRGGNSSTMTLIAWASDGFPIYARYGYSDATDSSSAIKVMTGSYQHKTTIPETRPDTSIYELGMFQQDWEYVEGSGDLDECNGRFGVTPEFPNGIYHYFATDSYPYFQRCVKGEIEGGDNGGPPGGGPGGPGGPPIR